MSDKSRKKFERREVLITAEQEAFVQQDADSRYPIGYGPTGKKRNFSPALRDGIDFWRSHYDIFLTWITTRR